MKCWVLLFSMMLVGISVFDNVCAQKNIVDSSKNIIKDAQNLSLFYQKMQEAKQGKRSLQILHIGDSHIQAGFFTSRLREHFQTDIANGGRGLVFPYRLANTNGHMDVKFSSDVIWSRYRIITEDAPKVGIAGAAIYTDASKFLVQLRCDEENSFNQIEISGRGLEQIKLAIPKVKNKILKPKSERKIHHVKSGDVLGKISRKYGVSIKQLRKWNRLKGDMIRIGQKLVVYTRNKVASYNPDDFEWITMYEHSDTIVKAVLPEKITQLYVIKRTQTKGSLVTLYSMHLGNSQRGVSYEGIGYNGAKYTDYNRSPLFFSQLGKYRPDLVILSLGTNEAFDKVYPLESFREDVKFFCEELERHTGCKSVLFTTPPSALRKRRYTQEKLSDYAEVLSEIAEERNYAVWDLYKVMGGKNGIKHWYSAGLAGADRIHFTEKGYRVQADLLYEALIKETK